MKKIKNQLKKTFFALAFIVGAFLFCTAFCLPLPKGAKINGVDVGGLTHDQATQKVRSSVQEFLKEKTLLVEVDGQKFCFSHPEIDFLDDLQTLVPTIKKSGEYTANITFFLNGINAVAQSICQSVLSPPQEPYYVFNSKGAPFDYYSGKGGYSCEFDDVKSAIERSLTTLKFFYKNQQNFAPVHLKTTYVSPQNTLKTLKENTVKLSAYSTYFDALNVARSHNIALACEKINGCVILPGETFSFNATVGKRTAKNGFLSAKVIEGGKFVDGVGGGVCQVSTTLYNVALLSGLKIKEAHPHSLAVGYVPPSRDAMVSGSYCDLRFENQGDAPVFIRGEVVDGRITFTFYGKSDGNEYSVESVVLEKLPAPESEKVFGDEEKIIAYGKDGVISESYLVVKNGQKVEKRRIRKDKYAPVAGIMQIIDG